MDADASRLYRIRKTVIEMLRDRQYLVSQEDANMTPDEFQTKFFPLESREKLMLMCSKQDPTDKRAIFVFFPDDQKVGVKPIRRYIDRMKAEGVNRAIIVVQNQLTSFARQALSSIQKYTLEHFLEAELLVNITHHMLVPKHQLLPDPERKALLERYKLKETQLPRIQLSDPVARYYGLERGQVVKIVRPSETAGRYVTYRYVI
eukprot:gnl/Hemi2/24363_TR8186_c0_g1_i1.p1 gnl/Hemi2/24363_TR8186_c0_g1~~gnl/Hemi2/24363_TR8186_c0_g1_i1.p1  ORF type:complete len:224 (+),score=51.18 gnl/Hemi2/24363_TR8186_c0_g1_i1:62-673(+)